MGNDHRSSPSLTIVTAAVFLAGVLMEMYGLYFLLAPRALLEAMLWIGGGLLVQVASGARGRADQGQAHLVNPFIVIGEAVRNIRHRVQGWDERQ